MSHKKWIRVSLYVILGIQLVFLLLNSLFPLRINIKYSQIVTASDGTVLHAFLSSDEKWRMKTELNEITPTLKKAIIYKEDKYFYYHPGVNPVAILRAVVNNMLQSKKTSGASTITMQVARMLEPKNRTYANKVVEIFRALQLEWKYSKAEILQLYLNLVPYGSNIEGVKSASLIYFQQAPGYMSLAQTVALTIIPNRPSSLVIGKDNMLIVQERNKWLRRFAKDKIFPQDEIKDALLEPLDDTRHNVPRLAPHLSLRMTKVHRHDAIIHSCIDKMKQEKVENIAYNYVQRIHYMGITNCAVLVVNNESNRVEAYLGAADFYNAEDHGQVDGVQAIRSPGSTLKPFLYALGFDKGMITPKSVIADVPVNFHGYMPLNYDKKFRGNVTVETALANSLNVPAVKMLDQLGMQSFVAAMKLAGFAQVGADKDKLGLSTVLGGCGVKLEELTNLYACLADTGSYRKLLWTKEEHQEGAFQLISSGAAFMTTEILTQHLRPDLPNNYESSMHLPKVAWKTGTSYGRRDAWSIGYNKEYTIGVWVGNFSGNGIPELTGADIATPLLFDLFNTLAYNSSNEWFQMPKSLDFRYVCAASGSVPNDFCTEQVMDYFIPGVSGTQKCNHLKEVFVAADESISYCRNCLPENGYKKILYPNLKPELVSFYEFQNIPYEKVPQHNPHCSRIYTENAPSIITPTDGLEYLLEKDEQQQLLLSCNADNEVKTIYWYINNRFFATAGVHDKVFFTPEEGTVKISCTDDKGRNSDVTIEVKYLE
ncbi:MAG: penicillin-binding protein 1C [Chitinophagaceae bacterium]|nr:penicillin-binding protein 1C [Chitinophagaceae bacterium]